MALEVLTVRAHNATPTSIKLNVKKAIYRIGRMKLVGSIVNVNCSDLTS